MNWNFAKYDKQVFLKLGISPNSSFTNFSPTTPYQHLFYHSSNIINIQILQISVISTNNPFFFLEFMTFF